MRYDKIYNFQAISKCEEGKCVFLVDLEHETVWKLGCIALETVLEAVNDETGRYAFFVCVDDEKEKEEVE